MATPTPTTSTSKVANSAHKDMQGCYLSRSHTMKTLLDRVDTTHVRTLDRMIAELSPHMSEFEIDASVELLNTLASSKFDINLSVDDAKTQLKLLLGSERYEMIKCAWALKNQHLIVDGRTKYICKKTNMVYDGLDPHDSPEDYTMVRM